MVTTSRFSSGFAVWTEGFLWLVFKNVASIYFLLVSLFQIFTPWSPTGKFSTAAPFFGNKVFEVLMLSIENKYRQLSDFLINSRHFLVIRPDGLLSTKKRKDLRVGDVIVLRNELNNRDVPADILLIYSPTRSVFVDMSSLTGEKDAVQKTVPGGLDLEFETEKPLNFFAMLRTSKISRHLDDFRGELVFGSQRIPCNADNIILSGCEIKYPKNSEVLGLVFAVGPETKINQKEAGKLKSSYLEGKLNMITICMIVVLVLLIGLGVSGSYIMVSLETFSFGAILIQYFLLFNGIVSQTLNFSLDLVRKIQSQTDPDSFEVHNTSSLESLGLVDLVVFDKTGTLTANNLKTRLIATKSSELGVVDLPSMPHLAELSSTDFDLSSSTPPSCAASPSTSSSALSSSLEAHKERDEAETLIKEKHDLLVAILINNSLNRILPDGNMVMQRFFGDDKVTGIRYAGTSADEIAILDYVYSEHSYFLLYRTSNENGRDEIGIHHPLVPMLANICNVDTSLLSSGGVSSDDINAPQMDSHLKHIDPFSSSSSNGSPSSSQTSHLFRQSSSLIDVLSSNRIGKDYAEQTYEIIYVQKYSSKTRKMVVVARDPKQNHVLITVKGSAERLMPMIKSSEREIASQRVNDMAQKGMRVLVYLQSKVSVTAWSSAERFIQKCRSEEEKDLVFDIFRGKMNFLGCTGTEDKLHTGLEKAITQLHQAGIKTVICTGDIKQTALLIARNTAIFPPSARLIDRSDLYSSFASSSSSSSSSVEDCEKDEKDGVIFDIQGTRDEIVDQLAIAEECGPSIPKGIMISGTSVIEQHKDPVARDRLQSLLQQENCAGIVVYGAIPEAKVVVTSLSKSAELFTCSVGDGANDIQMIKEADVGVGIIAGENQEAASASDIALKVSTLLPRCILHYGKLNWQRNVALTHLMSVMKLTIISAMCFYDTINGFNCNPLFFGSMLLGFNLFYGWGVLAYALLHNSTTLKEDLEHPELFKASPRKALTSVSSYWRSWSLGIISGILSVGLATLYETHLSQWDEDGSVTIEYFGQHVRLESYFCFVLLLVWTNLQVSIQEGFSQWSRMHKVTLFGLKISRPSVVIHLVVLTSIFVVLTITVIPFIHALPLSFFLAIPFSILFLFVSQLFLDRVLFGRLSRLPSSLSFPSKVKKL